MLFAVAAFAEGPGQARETHDRAKTLFEDICTSCHTLDRVERQRLTKEEWAGTIKGMVDEGAAVTDEEFSIIVDYLAKNFGEKKDSQ